MRTDKQQSEFMDDEFAIYNLNQICLKYVIEYEEQGAPKLGLNLETTTLPSTLAISHSTSIEALVSTSETNAKQTEQGLLTSSGKLVPLQSVAVKAKILDLACEVVIFQQFKNDEDILGICFLYFSYLTRFTHSNWSEVRVWA